MLLTLMSVEATTIVEAALQMHMAVRMKRERLLLTSMVLAVIIGTMNQ